MDLADAVAEPAPVDMGDEGHKGPEEVDDTPDLWAVVECHRTDTAWGSCRPAVTAYTSKAVAQQALAARYAEFAADPEHQPATRCSPPEPGCVWAIYGYEQGAGSCYFAEFSVMVQRLPVRSTAPTTDAPQATSKGTASQSAKKAT